MTIYYCRKKKKLPCKFCESLGKKNNASIKPNVSNGPCKVFFNYRENGVASKNPNRLSLLSAYNLNISSTVAIELSTLKICESQICIMHLHTDNELKHAVNLQNSDKGGCIVSIRGSLNYTTPKFDDIFNHFKTHFGLLWVCHKGPSIINISSFSQMNILMAQFMHTKLTCIMPFLYILRVNVNYG